MSTLLKHLQLFDILCYKGSTIIYLFYLTALKIIMLWTPNRNFILTACNYNIVLYASYIFILFMQQSEGN